MSEKIPLKSIGKIERATVSDEEATSWVRTLVEAGFSNEEIDKMMSNLNETYKNKIKEAEIEKEFRKISDDLKKRKGYKLSKDEAVRIKQGIASRFK